MNRISNPNTELIGKTIESVDTSACNLNVIHFTDGTSVTIETEYFGGNIYGPVWYEGHEESLWINHREAAKP